ncbi:hypothetical protein SDC9_75592 [bioreactor metagenome]|uniref:Uncharacterized protein n=1 Tax=bioreactor metagenome TaxID=1076179 RepID=A0A644YRF6_9ZZZZ
MKFYTHMFSGYNGSRTKWITNKKGGMGMNTHFFCQKLGQNIY